MNKHKYFFRGMGTALIIISSIFYFITINNTKDVTKNTKLSDDEIIIRAKELGMVSKDEIDKEEIVKEKVIKENLSDEDIIKRAKLLGMEFIEASNESENEENIETSKNVENIESVKVKISYGMSSDDIANLLYEEGIVDDAQKLDKYLIRNRYDGKLKTGNYIFDKNSTYEEIMKKITN